MEHFTCIYVALPWRHLVSVTLQVMRSKHRADLALSVFDGAPLPNNSTPSFRRFHCIFLVFPCTLFALRSGERYAHYVTYLQSLIRCMDRLTYCRYNIFVM